MNDKTPETTTENQAQKPSEIGCNDLLAPIDEEKAYAESLAKDLSQLQDALGCPCEMDGNATDNAMCRIRDLISAEGELGDLKEFVKEEVIIEIYNPKGENQDLLKRLKPLIN